MAEVITWDRVLTRDMVFESQGNGLERWLVGWLVGWGFRAVGTLESQGVLWTLTIYLSTIFCYAFSQNYGSRTCLLHLKGNRPIWRKTHFIFTSEITIGGRVK